MVSTTALMYFLDVVAYIFKKLFDKMFAVLFIPSYIQEELIKNAD